MKTEARMSSSRGLLLSALLLLGAFLMAACGDALKKVETESQQSSTTCRRLKPSRGGARAVRWC